MSDSQWPSQFGGANPEAGFKPYPTEPPNWDPVAEKKRKKVILGSIAAFTILMIVVVALANILPRVLLNSCEFYSFKLKKGYILLIYFRIFVESCSKDAVCVNMLCDKTEKTCSFKLQIYLHFNRFLSVQQCPFNYAWKINVFH